MTTIFLHLGPRKSGGELLPDAPFRAFVKFKTAHDKKGGCVVLKLEINGEQVGTATIDWNEVETRRHPEGGKYLVGDGSLDDVDVSDSFSDWQIANLIFEAIVRAKWPYFGYDHGLEPRLIKERFEQWVGKNM